MTLIIYMFILKGFLSVIGWEALLYFSEDCFWKNCYPEFFDVHSNIYREVKKYG